MVHFEIGCKDSAKTQEFYKKLFDWKVDAMGPAAMIAAEAGGITGHITALGHEPHHYTIFYVDVDDVGAYLRKSKITRRKDARSSGGDSHWNIRVDAGSGRQYGGAVEGEEVNCKRGREFADQRVSFWRGPWAISKDCWS